MTFFKSAGTRRYLRHKRKLGRVDRSHGGGSRVLVLEKVWEKGSVKPTDPGHKQGTYWANENEEASEESGDQPT